MRKQKQHVVNNLNQKEKIVSLLLNIKNREFRKHVFSVTMTPIFKTLETKISKVSTHSLQLHIINDVQN